jgi:type I restriction enzyme M protein
MKEIQDNNYDLSFSKYREVEYEDVKYEKPQVVKEKVLDLEREIVRKLEEIDTS